MEREREIYTKMTQAFKEVYQQTHATKVGQTTSRVIILLVILTFGIDKRKLFLISSKRARKYVIYLNMIFTTMTEIILVRASLVAQW